MSSHAMSSFLQDFDLGRGGRDSNLKYRQYLDDNEDESHFCLESPVNNRSMSSFVKGHHGGQSNVN